MLEALLNTDFSEIIVIILFIIPGFISIKTYEMINPSSVKAASKTVIDAIAYSCFNYAIISWIFLLWEHCKLFSKLPKVSVLLILLVLFILPVLWAFLFYKLRRSKLMKNIAPDPILLPWDCVFVKKERYWVKAHLKNGEIIAGWYGGQSYSSSFPAEPQIYLQECWNLNKKNGFDRVKNNTNGVLILSSELSYLELYKS